MENYLIITNVYLKKLLSYIFYYKARVLRELESITLQLI